MSEYIRYKIQIDSVFGFKTPGPIYFQDENEVVKIFDSFGAAKRFIATHNFKGIKARVVVHLQGEPWVAKKLLYSMGIH